MKYLQLSLFDHILQRTCRRKAFKWTAKQHIFWVRFYSYFAYDSTAGFKLSLLRWYSIIQETVLYEPPTRSVGFSENSTFPRGFVDKIKCHFLKTSENMVINSLFFRNIFFSPKISIWLRCAAIKIASGFAAWL